jgi:glucose/arabinose dehydrogenase
MHPMHPFAEVEGLRTSRLVELGVCLSFAAGASGCGSEAGPSPPQGTGVQLEQVAVGMSAPLYLTSPPGDPRLFIVEKTGAIRIVKDGAVLPDPFLNLSAQVSGGGEQGLLGLAFDPDYASNGRLFVHYTDPAGQTRVSRFLVSADPDRADPATEQMLLTASQPFANHNGGQLTFGPDGFLYLGLGDGGASNDPEGRGQSLADLLGSILRIDARTGDTFTVPADNPFVGVVDAQPLVWSYGLRNPWRFSFDRATGDLYIADVGEAQFEEINVATSGAGTGRGINYGWSIMEGGHCRSGDACDQTGLALPAFEYSHAQGCSVTGGYVYRGGAIPAIQGVYFFADYCAGWVRSFRYSGDVATELTDWPALRPGGPVTSFGEDSSGELYVMSESGEVFRFVPGP